MKTSHMIAGKYREVCPNCTSHLTSPISFSHYDPATRVEDYGSVCEHVCANCGIRFISTETRKQIKANLLLKIDKEREHASEEY